MVLELVVADVGAATCHACLFPAVHVARGATAGWRSHHLGRDFHPLASIRCHAPTLAARRARIVVIMTAAPFALSLLTPSEVFPNSAVSGYCITKLIQCQ